MSLKGKLLIATPLIETGILAKSVVLVCSDNDNKYLGIAINIRMDGILIHDLFSLINKAPDDDYLKVSPYLGGPDEMSEGFTIHSNDYFLKGHTKIISNDISYTLTTHMMEDLEKSKGPKKFHIIFGCILWEIKELENKINEGGWLVTNLDSDLIFKIDSPFRWQAAMHNAGYNLAMFSPYTGKC